MDRTDRHEIKSHRKQLGGLLQKENEQLARLLSREWGQSPLPGVTMEHWGLLMNAMIDGLAVQALLVEEFPKDDAYGALEQLVHYLTKGGHGIDKA